MWLWLADIGTDVYFLVQLHSLPVASVMIGIYFLQYLAAVRLVYGHCYRRYRHYQLKKYKPMEAHWYERFYLYSIF